MIILDNSVLVNSLTGSRKSADLLERLAETNEELAVPTLVMYEWLRGPRLSSELAAFQRFIAPESIVPFGLTEATLAADLYISVGRPRTRAFDLAIAACAILRDAPLWTLNPKDFQDIPHLRLYRAS